MLAYPMEIEQKIKGNYYEEELMYWNKGNHRENTQCIWKYIF